MISLARLIRSATFSRVWIPFRVRIPWSGRESGRRGEADARKHLKLTGAHSTGVAGHLG
jgi:hypothetical protein